MPKLLLASTNRGKLVEMQDLLPDFDLILPQELSLRLDVEETGATYAENAALKAAAYFLASKSTGTAGGLVTLADDSGLEVDCLGGAPGLHSARYSPHPGATDADRRALLLQNLVPFPRPWTAHFHCTVAIAALGSEILFADGDCPGEIIPQERGSNGFGYDPIFLLAAGHKGLTMAELSRAQKNLLSHRARAVTAALPVLRRLLGA